MTTKAPSSILKTNVVSAIKTDTQTISSSGGTFHAVTGLSVVIRPSDASKKVLLQGVVVIGSDVGAGASHGLRITRNGTPIALGDAASSRNRLTVNGAQVNAATASAIPFCIVDSPNTDTNTTYAVEIIAFGGSMSSLYVNRSGTDVDSGLYGRSVSTIVAQEV